MEVLHQKIVTALLSCILTFVLGSLPIYLSWKLTQSGTFIHYSRLRTALSLLSCLSAGVFLGTCLLELFPEVQISLMEAFTAYGIRSSFPFAQFVAAVGLFIVLTIETLFFSFHGVFERRSKDIINSTRSYGSSAPLQTGDTDFFPDVSNSQNTFDASRMDISLGGQSGDKPFRAFILLVALSLHTFFEGLTCGLEPTDGAVWPYAIALCVHKPLIAIGINISYLRTTWGSVRFVSFVNLGFSVISAIGIAIGTVGVAYEAFDLNAVRVVTGILQGLASGSFFYVVFLEVLPYEMASHAEGIKRICNLVALVFGFGITIAMIMFHRAKGQLCIGG